MPLVRFALLVAILATAACNPATTATLQSNASDHLRAPSTPPPSPAFVKDDPAVQSLLLEGGLTAGYFLAEACDWRVALELLESPDAHDLPPIERGLFEGSLRMVELRHTTSYEPDTWSEADLAEVERRLLRWAIRDILDKSLENPREVRIVELGCRSRTASAASSAVCFTSAGARSSSSKNLGS